MPNDSGPVCLIQIDFYTLGQVSFTRVTRVLPTFIFCEFVGPSLFGCSIYSMYF